MNQGCNQTYPEYPNDSSPLVSPSRTGLLVLKGGWRLPWTTFIDLFGLEFSIFFCENAEELRFIVLEKGLEFSIVLLNTSNSLLQAQVNNIGL
jgi:hypothetical protein